MAAYFLSFWFSSEFAFIGGSVKTGVEESQTITDMTHKPCVNTHKPWVPGGTSPMNWWMAHAGKKRSGLAVQLGVLINCLVLARGNWDAAPSEKQNRPQHHIVGRRNIPSTSPESIVDAVSRKSWAQSQNRTT